MPAADLPPTLAAFGLTLSEPMTALTDYLLAAVGGWCGARLYRSARHEADLPQRRWALAFFFIGLGALLGGTSHGFALYLGDDAATAIWKATVYAVGVSMWFALAGTIAGSGLPDRWRQFLGFINSAGLVLYALWMLYHDDFVYVIADYLAAMLAVALLQGYALFRHRGESAPWIIAGVVVTLLGALVQQSGFAMHRHFNHNDLYHVVQIGGLLLLYRGARLLVPL